MSDEALRQLRRKARESGDAQDVMNYVDAALRAIGAPVPKDEADGTLRITSAGQVHGAWAPLLPTPSLSEVLAVGNRTGGHEIVLTQGDAIVGPTGRRLALEEPVGIPVPPATPRTESSQ